MEVHVNKRSNASFFCYNLDGDNMNYAYVTLLSTNNYYDGVLVLFESLKKTKPKYNNFVVIVNEDIDKDKIDDLKRRGYEVIEKKKIDGSKVKNNTYKHWSNTFDKFNVFDLDYDKIVYLDSDMYINKNIDELFLLPHMSASIAGKGMNNDWDNLNSGMMVIEPDKRIKEGLIELLNSRDHEDVGDQDLIGEYFDWRNKNLEISENYNMFAGYVDHYVNELNYKVEDIAIIHYVGSRKPWMLDGKSLSKELTRLNKENKKIELDFLSKYIRLFEKIK